MVSWDFAFFFAFGGLSIVVGKSTLPKCFLWDRRRAAVLQQEGQGHQEVQVPHGVLQRRCSRSNHGELQLFAARTEKSALNHPVFYYREICLLWAVVASWVTPVHGPPGWRSFPGLLRRGFKSRLVCIPWLLSAALSSESKRCRFIARIIGGFRHQTQSNRRLTVNTNVLPVNVVLISVLLLGSFLPVGVLRTLEVWFV